MECQVDIPGNWAVATFKTFITCLSPDLNVAANDVIYDAEGAHLADMVCTPGHSP